MSFFVIVVVTRSVLSSKLSLLDQDDMKAVQSVIQQNISAVSEISHKFLCVE